MFSERFIISLHEVIVEGSVGALGGTDCHCGEVQVRDGVGGDGGGHRGLLPGSVGTVYKISSSTEPQTNYQAPYQLATICLIRFENRLDLFTDYGKDKAKAISAKLLEFNLKVNQSP